MGNGLPEYAQKLAPLFSEIIIVVEPFETSLSQSQALIEDIISLGAEKSRINVVANYRIRSDAQLSVQQIQDRLKYQITNTFTPAPELLMQAYRKQTSAVFFQAESLTTQQYTGLAAKIEGRATKPKPQN